jgi:hypothetical protein
MLSILATIVLGIILSRPLYVADSIDCDLLGGQVCPPATKELSLGRVAALVITIISLISFVSLYVWMAQKSKVLERR